MSDTLLLIEDDRPLAALTAEFLRAEGFTVAVEHRGDRAAQRIRDEQPALLILDVMLPGLNAWRLQQSIRKKGETPVLFLTTPEGIEDRLRELELHEDDYLLKPFEAKALVARVKKLLRRDRGR